MINKLKLFFLSTLIISLLTPVVATGAVLAQATGPDIKGSLCEGADLRIGGDKTCSSGTGRSPQESMNEMISQIVNIISVIVAVVAVIMIIFGGFKYITSGGDSSNITSAKNTILYAIIGLIIVALAQFIVKFVLGKATGLTT